MKINTKLKVKVSRKANILEGYTVASHYFNDNLLLVINKDGKYGYINKKGEEVISCQFKEATSFSSGRAQVLINNKWGYIDTTGKLVIPCIYDSADEFIGEYARVKVIITEANTLYMIIDKSGVVLYSTNQNIVQVLSSGYIILFDGNKYTISNIKEEKARDKTQYGRIHYLGENLCFAISGEENLLITLGAYGVEKIKLDENILWLHEYSNGLISATFLTNFKLGDKKYLKYGFINNLGNVVIGPKFMDLPDKFNEGYSVVEGKKGKYIIDTKGSCLSGKQSFEFLKPGYIGSTFNPLFITDGRKNRRVFGENGNNSRRLGYINKNGKTVIPYLYEFAFPFKENGAFVQIDSANNDSKFFIDGKGNKLTKTITDEIEVSSIKELDGYDNFEILEYISEVKNGEETTTIKSCDKDDHDKKLALLVRNINLDTLSEFMNPGYQKKPN